MMVLAAVMTEVLASAVAVVAPAPPPSSLQLTSHYLADFRLAFRTNFLGSYSLAA